MTITVINFFLLGIFCQSVYSQSQNDKQLKDAEEINANGLELINSGLYSESIEQFNKALLIAAKVKGTEDALVAKTYNNLGVAYYYLGNFQKATEYYEKAKAIWIMSSDQDQPKIAVMYQNLGVIYGTLGNNLKAIEYIEKSIHVMQKSLDGNNKFIGTSYMNLGAIYLKIGNYKEADTAFHQALSILLNATESDNPDVVTLYQHMAIVCKHFGNYQQAMEYLQWALKIQLRSFSDNNRTTAFLYSTLGIIYTEFGNYQQAIDYYEKAIAIYLRSFGKYNIYTPSLYSNLYFSSLLSNANQATLERMLRTYSNSASISLFRQLNYLSETELAFFLESENGFIYEECGEMFFSFPFSKPAPTDALLTISIVTKGVLYSQKNKFKEKIHASDDFVLSNSYIDLLSLKQQINKAYEMTLAERKWKNINIDSLLNVADEMESKMFRKLGIEMESKGIQWQDVQSTIKQDEAIVDIIRVQGVFRDSLAGHVFKKDTVLYAALIVTKETLLYPEMVVLPRGSEMEGLWFQNYLSHTSGTNKLLNDNSSYMAYWQTIADKLKDKTHIYFCPDGIYNKINLNVLFNSSDSSYLADEKDIQLVTNIKEVIKLKQDTIQRFISKNMNAVVIGNPKFNLSASDTLLFARNTRSLYDNDVSVSALDTFTRGLNISQLPGTEKEVNFISSTLKNYGWNVSTYTGNSATEEVIKSLRSPNILHIATHGYFLEDNSSNKNINGLQLLGQSNSSYHDNPLLRSGLLFAGAQNTFKGNESENRDNGVLTSQEAMSLFLDSTDLVVLSACETAGGDVKNGEGVYGLQRAFRVAGAHSILMSMWKVDDEATKELMTAFYKNWIEDGMNKHNAFKSAQLQLRKIPQYNHPYYWGAFVMVGE